MGYLGFCVTWNGIRPINMKVESMVNMTPPKSQNQVLVFICLSNYYMYMWTRQVHLLQYLNALTSNRVTFKWVDVEQKAFGYIIHRFSQKTSLAYPYFNKRFHIHMDASNLQLGEVIIRGVEPINCFTSINCQYLNQVTQ